MAALKNQSLLFIMTEKRKFLCQAIFNRRFRNKKVLFISEHESSYLELASTDFNTVVDLSFVKPKGKTLNPMRYLI